MNVNLPSEQRVIQEALQILMNHMEPLKVARFIAACNLDRGDYLQIKEQLFEGETVDSLFEKIQAFEIAKHES